MTGPYRTRLVAPETHEAFWRGLERRLIWGRRVPRVVFGLALLPALSVPLLTTFDPTEQPKPDHALKKAVGLPMSEPFGLVIGPDRAAFRRGALPPGVARPDLEPSAASPATIQAAIARGASGTLSRCYDSALRADPTIAGELVVSVAVGVHGPPRSMVTGPLALRNALGSCSASALESVSYPRPQREPHWFHYPLRFESTPPAG